MPPVVPTPTVPIQFVQAKAGEIINLGSIKLRVMETGQNTGNTFPIPQHKTLKLKSSSSDKQPDNRISAMELIIPPKTPGPPPHWHEMHDETFLVTKGTVRFIVPEAPGLEGKVIDAKEGDYVVVPTRAPHTFSNESDEEARFFNTFTPVRISDSRILGGKGGALANESLGRRFISIISNC